MLVVAGTLVAALVLAGITNMQTVNAASRSAFGGAVSSQGQNQEQGSFGGHQANAAQNTCDSTTDPTCPPNDETPGLGQFNARSK